MPGRTCLGSTTSKGGKSKFCRRGLPSTASFSGEEAAMEGEKEEEARIGEVDLRSVWRQKEKEEDQRGQGWDFGNCLSCERERDKSGEMEREKGRVRVRRVAMRMFAIRRALTRDDRLIF